VLISICAPTSSGIEFGKRTTKLGRDHGLSLQAQNAREEGHSQALFQPESRIDLVPTSLRRRRLQSGTRPPEAIVGGRSKAGEPMIPRDPGMDR